MLIFNASCRVGAHVELMRKFEVIVEFDSLFALPIVIESLQLDAEVRWKLANAQTLYRVKIFLTL